MKDILINQMSDEWQEFLKDEFNKPYFIALQNRCLKALEEKEPILPSVDLLFYAFKITPLKDLKVIILGQDPYHKKDQAMGLSFSVPKGVKIPASLRNIFKELNSDLGIKISTNGDLSKWAKQGVLLLNSIFSVYENKPQSHKNWGWCEFSDEVIKKLSLKKKDLIFLLWGNFAKSKIPLIDTNKHFILSASHPSPLARSGFLGCKHFSKTNSLLKKRGKKEIIWA
ncbi:uracil-DNA glycosylase [Campylobacter sp. LR286c]|uniref:uracil-DNA glycosylase n=1 Tax=Campylobacter sp. LR286c TaxID=2593545 RepID=UPI001237F9FA|nr:uracil-DNA glycosylase [Campylobacter sp. LR286c]KAA6224862.1 uracil-DNA glycosylase [Campylobacter sp. LR286c]